MTMPSDLNESLSKLLRLAVSTKEEGEALAALARIRRMLERDGMGAPDLKVFVGTVETEVLSEWRWEDAPPSRQTRYDSVRDLVMDGKAEAYVMKFGKYKGRTFRQVWHDNPGYITWMKASFTNMEPALKELVEYFAAE